MSLSLPISVAELASRARCHVARMVYRANASHIGGCFSLADILAVLYGEVLDHRPEDPTWQERDRVILSKGHAAAALYAVLAESNYFPIEELQQYGQDGSRLLTHVSHGVPGVEFSTGSLGHGLPVACGKALAAKRSGWAWRTFALLSDGELDEGSNWEAILFAGHHRLGRLTAIIDYNKIQSFGTLSQVLDLHPLADKFRAFRWDVAEVNGHDHSKLCEALAGRRPADAPPLAVIAHTVKGKGVDFMEHQLKYHYSAPRSGEQLQEVLRQLERTE